MFYIVSYRWIPHDDGFVYCLKDTENYAGEKLSLNLKQKNILLHIWSMKTYVIQTNSKEMKKCREKNRKREKWEKVPQVKTVFTPDDLSEEFNALKNSCFFQNRKKKQQIL